MPKDSTAFKLILFIFAKIYSTKSDSNNFEVFITEHLRPNLQSTAGSWARCRADEMINPDPDG